MDINPSVERAIILHSFYHNYVSSKQPNLMLSVQICKLGIDKIFITGWQDNETWTSAARYMIRTFNRGETKINQVDQRRFGKQSHPSKAIRKLITKVLNIYVSCTFCSHCGDIYMVSTCYMCSDTLGRTITCITDNTLCNEYTTCSEMCNGVRPLYNMWLHENWLCTKNMY